VNKPLSVGLDPSLDPGYSQLKFYMRFKFYEKLKEYLSFDYSKSSPSNLCSFKNSTLEETNSALDSSLCTMSLNGPLKFN